MDAPSKIARDEVRRRPDGHGRRATECGDAIEFFLAVRGGLVERVALEVEGCAFTIAAARAAAAQAEGRDLHDARRELTPASVEALLGGLPEPNKHCAELAAFAMQDALQDAVVSGRDPWRKLYRNRS